MHFNFFLAASFFCTLVSGLTIPTNTLAARNTDLEVRQNLLDDTFDLVEREPGRSGKIKGAPFELSYTVKAGGGKPSQTYSHSEVKQAVSDANHEHQRLQAPGVGNGQRRNSPLKVFNNNKHRLPKKSGASHAKTFPKMKGTGYEYPLPNKNPHAPVPKGPARVILQEKNGRLEFHGVVAHDQSRHEGSKGHNDHFEVKGKRHPSPKH